MRCFLVLGSYQVLEGANDRARGREMANGKMAADGCGFVWGSAHDEQTKWRTKTKWTTKRRPTGGASDRRSETGVSRRAANDMRIHLHPYRWTKRVPGRTRGVHLGAGLEARGERE